MTRFRFCFVFFVLAMLSTSCIASKPMLDYTPEEMRDKAVFEKVSPSILEIENYRFDSFVGHPILYCTGSGFCWDGDNHVVTNAHVVQYASALKVVLRNGEKRDARIVGVNYAEDIALLYVTTFDPLVDQPLVPIDKGDSDDIFVGQAVYTFGFPFGLPLSMCKGIISGLFKDEAERNDIQTDAAVNPGNSGGALVDIHGRLIGMPTYIYTRSGANHGCGFALPINRIKKVVAKLMEDAKIPDLNSNKLFFQEYL